MRTHGWAVLVTCVSICAACGSDDTKDEPGAGATGGTAGSGATGGVGGSAGSGGVAGTAGSGGVAGTAGAAGVAGDGGGAGASCNDGTAWDPTWQQMECETITLINEARAAGVTCDGKVLPPVGPLQRHQLLTDIGRAHAKDMGDNDYFDWNKPGGDMFPDWVASAGFSGTLSGQMILSGLPDASSVIDTLLAGGAGCTDLMHPDAEHVAVGYYNIDSGFEHYWVVFYASDG